jgi:energy-coupling factor transport system permease protein
MLVCVGAANSLASPVRLVRALPGALYEAGVAVVVAFSLVPQSLVVVRRIRAARRLRGQPDRGLRALRGMALPVLEEALERSVSLAASMDSRGYGRRAAVPRALQYATGTLTLGGLLGLCVGVYGLLDGTTPAVLGGPALAAGVALAVAGLVLGGRRVVRTRYRPDHWRAPELVAVAAGLLVAACFAAAPATGTHPPTAPLAWPPLPVLPVLGALVAAAPGLLTPPAPRTVLA